MPRKLVENPLILRIGEVVLLILPGLCVALGSIYLPWHFKRMGTACFGIYVVHVPLAYEAWTEYIQEPILQIITKPSWSPALNILIVLVPWIIFCSGDFFSLFWDGKNYHIFST